MENADLTPELVSRLVASQFPEWARLPVRPVDLDGNDNRTFRLGRELSVRLPSADEYIPQVEKEHRWLPWLAPQLPLAIPEPVAQGVPAIGFPRPWSVYRWLPGQLATADMVHDTLQFAADLAGFLSALHSIDPAGGPAAGVHSFCRGGPLSVLDAGAREAIVVLANEVDARAATEVWETALAAASARAPVWVHGDITNSNLLVVDGRLRAVLDFGCCAVGDPACDLAIAWTFFTSESRHAFRSALPFDEETWARARGWALWKALITHADVIRTRSRRDDAATRFGWRLTSRGVIDEVLASD